MIIEKKRRARARTRGYHYLILSFAHGFLIHVSMAKTERGAQKSASHDGMTLPDYYQTKIIPVADILEWESAGIRELEALARL